MCASARGTGHLHEGNKRTARQRSRDQAHRTRSAKSASSPVCQSSFNVATVASAIVHSALIALVFHARVVRIAHQCTGSTPAGCAIGVAVRSGPLGQTGKTGHEVRHIRANCDRWTPYRRSDGRKSSVRSSRGFQSFPATVRFSAEIGLLARGDVVPPTFRIPDIRPADRRACCPQPAHSPQRRPTCSPRCRNPARTYASSSFPATVVMMAPPEALRP